MSGILTPAEIRTLIHHVRGKAVMLDSDLAELYEVETRALNQAVRRNIDRFPEDLMFQLTRAKFDNLISQSVTSSSHGGRRKLPLVFTEQGVAMLSSVLRSDVAVKTNISIMRAFVQVRRFGVTIAELKRRIDRMEQNFDRRFKVVFDAIKQLLAPPPARRGNGEWDSGHRSDDPVRFVPVPLEFTCSSHPTHASALPLRSGMHRIRAQGGGYAHVYRTNYHATAVEHGERAAPYALAFTGTGRRRAAGPAAFGP
ncbi:MAG: hypothetical protein GF331_06690 [Chitinivibrionales bacterium]|nr:hypothetical protein [Chitinivibrionales bacterium]